MASAALFAPLSSTRLEDDPFRAYAQATGALPQRFLEAGTRLGAQN